MILAASEPAEKVGVLFHFYCPAVRRRTSSRSQSFQTAIPLTFCDEICPPSNPKVVKTSGRLSATPESVRASSSLSDAHLALIQTTINTSYTMIRRRAVHHHSNYTYDSVYRIELVSWIAPCRSLQTAGSARFIASTLLSFVRGASAGQVVQLAC